MLDKLKKRYKLWKLWASRNLNGPLYKFLVLIGLTKSPTFELVYIAETGPIIDIQEGH